MQQNKAQNDAKILVILWYSFLSILFRSLPVSQWLYWLYSILKSQVPINEYFLLFNDVIKLIY